MDIELSEYFGALVVVQLRDAVAHVTAGPTGQYAVIGAGGQPVLDPASMQPVGRQQITPVCAGDDFSLIFTGRLFPAQGGRVHVCYEHDGHIMRMTVRPSDIVSVSWVEGRSSESRIERPKGS